MFAFWAHVFRADLLNCTCLCCKRLSFKCVYGLFKALGCCVKTEFVDPSCRARVQTWASFSAGPPAPTGSVLIGLCRQIVSICFCLSSWIIDIQQTGCRTSFFLRAVFCFSFHPLSASFLYPLFSLLQGGGISLLGLRGLFLPLKPGSSCKPHGKATDCFSRSFHKRQGSLVVLEETRAVKLANHIACIDKWFSTGILWSELKRAWRLCCSVISIADELFNFVLSDDGSVLDCVQVFEVY